MNPDAVPTSECFCFVSDRTHAAVDLVTTMGPTRTGFAKALLNRWPRFSGCAQSFVLNEMGKENGGTELQMQGHFDIPKFLKSEYFGSIRRLHPFTA
jgi:hypothetical protein